MRGNAGKGLQPREAGADFHARRGTGWVVLLRSSCPSLHTCLVPPWHHCSLSPQDRGLPTSRHIPLCQGTGANKVPEKSTEPIPQLCAPPVTAPVGSMPQAHCLPTSQEKSPKDLQGDLGHEVPRDGSCLVLLHFTWARGCSAQKGTNKDSYSSSLNIWDPTSKVCEYICVPVPPCPSS